MRTARAALALARPPARRRQHRRYLRLEGASGAAVAAHMAEPPTKRAQVPVAVRASLDYQKHVPGKRTGRYIGREDEGDLADEHEPHEVDLRNARMLSPSATLDTRCFELRRHPTAVKDFRDDEEVKRVYYQEVEALVKEATGAERVIVFDHTVRETTVSNLNSLQAGGSSSAVRRVHTDYSDKSGPKRLRTLAESGGYTGVKLSSEEKDEILKRDFLIVNVWRNIKEDEPVVRAPLAVLDPASLDKEDFVVYEMHYPERIGENYALRFREQHEWFFYPRMEKDECLVFKTFESRTDVPRYCFHTAFEDPATPADAPPRMSIECRSVAVLPGKM